ncbi:hypothetical protein [Pseudonocardia sp. ICBG1293]|uniref:hypothetical protein n=1 Tax=Pseudonocardia sp. ICBG1293 TaxID=2844382 RepID=UPI001CCB5DF3|nr:hypothetical protein [Pseudonocardia sp. ICBG1293]
MADTDGGRLDGDPVLDRAVGPMQFLPETWRATAPTATATASPIPSRWTTPPSPRPATCVRTVATSPTPGLVARVLAYNASGDYARDVWAAAADYAQRTTAPVPPAP